MLLCDIGNSSYHFYDLSQDYKKDVHFFEPQTIKEKVYYICVNQAVSQKLHRLENWIDISPYVAIDRYYSTIGIDRVFACEAVASGLIIDAGSAITVDIVKDHKYHGGFIYPGVHAMQETYKKISPRLDYSFNFEVDLDKMPKNSHDALSYGYLKMFHSEVLSHNMDIIITGGDAEKFAMLFSDAKVERLLIFHGMKKIITKADLC